MIKIGRNDPCPCGRAVKAKRCCLQLNGHLKKRPGFIIPSGPRTGYSHPNCFARGDGNCCDKITGEHFISRTLLRQVEKDRTAKIAGLKWQTPQRWDIISVSRLVSKMLYERHNKALSPLDEAIGYFFQMLQVYDDSTHPSVKDPKDELRLFAGEDLERWMLKCVLGLAVSKNIAGCVKPECADVLYGRVEWPPGWGLYLALTAPTTLYHSDSLVIEPGMGADGIIRKANFIIRGLPFVLSMGRPDNPEAVGAWRPFRLIAEDGRVEKIIEFSWGVPNSGQTLRITRRGSYDGPPPDWAAWERNG
jgi:hypothetical protein